MNATSGILTANYVSSRQLTASKREREGMSSTDYTHEYIAQAQAARHLWSSNDSGIMQVPLGRNELPELMLSIQRALDGGGTLAEAFQAQIDKHIALSGRTDGIAGVGTFYADLITVNAKTGEVLDSHPKSHVYQTDDTAGVFNDFDSVKSVADDFATFLRYIAFPQKDDNAEEVKVLMREIFAKQDGYDLSRFDAETGDIRIDTLARDLFLKKLSKNNEDGKDTIDEFMEMFGKHS